MNILQLISSSGFFGAENVVLQLSAQLAGLGHSITVGVFNDRRSLNLELAEKAKTYGLTVQQFECSGRWDWRTVALLRAYVTDKDVDIIHCHGYKSNFFALLASIGTHACLASTCHNWIVNSFKMRVYKALDALVLKYYDKVIPVSETVRGLLIQAGIKEGKISLIPNGIDINEFKQAHDVGRARRQFGFQVDDKVIGTVGRLSPEKGHSYFIEAAQIIYAHNQVCKFLIVGDGVLVQTLKEQAVRFGLEDCVVFAGKRTDISDLLSAMDVFVLPSLTEGLPMALLEAMAAKKAIVVTSVGAMPLVIENGKSGLVVPPGSAKEIANAVGWYLKHPDAVRTYAAQACHDVAEKYSSARMAADYLRIYRELRV